MENKHYSKLRNMVTDMSDGDFILGEENNHVEIGNIYKFKNICMTGDTGYGQSIYIHTLLLDLLNNCKDTKIIILDPIGVDFAIYKIFKSKKYDYIDDLKSGLSTIKRLSNLIDKLDNENNSEAIIKIRNTKIICIIHMYYHYVFADKDIEKYIENILKKGYLYGIHLVINENNFRKSISKKILNLCSVKMLFHIDDINNAVYIVGDHSFNKIPKKGSYCLIEETGDYLFLLYPYIEYENIFNELTKINCDNYCN